VLRVNKNEADPFRKQGQGLDRGRMDMSGSCLVQSSQSVCMSWHGSKLIHSKNT
jgi:hypothetical protein